MGSLGAMAGGECSDRYFQGIPRESAGLSWFPRAWKAPYPMGHGERHHIPACGLRSSMGYCGAADVEEVQEVHLVRVTSSGMTESHPHDIMITDEAPNYPLTLRQ